MKREQLQSGKNKKPVRCAAILTAAVMLFSLFGMVPVSASGDRVLLYPGGMPFGVRFFVNGVLVVGFADEEGGREANPAAKAGNPHRRRHHRDQRKNRGGRGPSLKAGRGFRRERNHGHPHAGHAHHDNEADTERQCGQVPHRRMGTRQRRGHRDRHLSHFGRNDLRGAWTRHLRHGHRQADPHEAGQHHRRDGQPDRARTAGNTGRNQGIFRCGKDRCADRQQSLRSIRDADREACLHSGGSLPGGEARRRYARATRISGVP